jgi:hypothetical protein
MDIFTNANDYSGVIEMRRLISIALLAIAGPAFAQVVKDNPKCEANPVFNRFPGEMMEKCDRIRLNELELMRWKQPGNAKSGAESFKVEGDYWYYFNGIGKDDSGRSPGKLEVQRNIEAAVLQAKGEVLYLGSGRVTYRLRKGSDEFWGESGCGRGGEDCSAVMHKIVRVSGAATAAGGEGVPMLLPNMAALAALKGSAGESLAGKVMQMPLDRRAALNTFIAQSEAVSLLNPTAGPVLYVGNLAGTEDFEFVGRGHRLGAIRDIAYLQAPNRNDASNPHVLMILVARREDTGQDYVCPVGVGDITAASSLADRIRKSSARIYCLETAESITPSVRKLFAEIWAGFFGYDAQKIFPVLSPILVFRGL